MNSKFREHIEEYGGKHGPLLYIREQVSGGRNLVPPMEIANLQELSQMRTAPELTRGLRAACAEVGATEFIARTSVPGFPGDWSALVDAEETISHLPVGVLTDDYPPSVARTLIEQLEGPYGFKKFAKQDGVELDLSKVTVSFSPQLPYPHSTITEHPNQPETVMVDVHRPFPPYKTYDRYEGSRGMALSEAVNFVGEEMRGRLITNNEELFDAGLDTRRLIIEAGLLDHGLEAYQYEGACRGNDLPHWLLQIRLFAPRRVADFELPQGKLVYGRNRLIGVTPPEGIELVYIQGETRQRALDFEQKNPNVPYLFDLAAKGTTQRLTLQEQLLAIRGYVVSLKPYLSHQSTRFAQKCLAHPGGGIVDLSSSTVGDYKEFQDGDLIRVTCDGSRKLVESI